MEKHLHIVAFNVPYPPNYGGVMDVYYRVKALSEAGVKVHLHCYTYGRKEAPELDTLCCEVFYYKRDTSKMNLFSRRPYIVASRDNKELCDRLQKDKHPILLEGLHCCSILEQEELCNGRLVMVRAHNVESDYYTQLAATESDWLRRQYLSKEVKKIGRYEGILTKADVVWAITEKDKKQLTSSLDTDVRLLSASHPYSKVLSRPGKDGYAFYHGNLSVAENNQAASHLMKLFAGLDGSLVVAGLNPPRWLEHQAAECPNVRLVPNPDDKEMQRLLANAQVNVLYTTQATGLKLKLLNALFCGRHCLVNREMVVGTPFAELCVVADTDDAMRREINRLLATPFAADAIEQRRYLLEPYSNVNVVNPLLDILSTT